MSEEKLTNEQRERLAAYAHEAWSGWMRWMFEQGGFSTIQADDNGETLTFWTMKPEKYERWQRQKNTPYADLPESEKASDRDEADKILAILFGDSALDKEIPGADVKTLGAEEHD